jgi:hypothetical protein
LSVGHHAGGKGSGSFATFGRAVGFGGLQMCLKALDLLLLKII